jgi:NAD(P)-dependent dehydrogenase (short-subunit alcohol dehydrogenase family)
MEIRGRNVLILGGSGLVGMAVARELLPLAPGRITISSLRRADAEDAVAALRREAADVELDAEWGDLFVPDALRERARADILSDAAGRSALLDDLFGELSERVVERSALGALLARCRPDIIVDCINTATAFAYQNVFRSAEELRVAARDGSASVEATERHLATLYLPQLIRHVQIALEGMRRAGTQFYLKIGTAGTGGMGLNIPFTHSEERPSRMLLAKAAVAGAHTLLLYLMARTPGAPAVKEIKPTAAIAWKRIDYGVVHRGGRPMVRADALRALPLEDAFASGGGAWHTTEEPIEGVFLDAGENGLFSRAEFEVLTTLGLMEFITPEEIAANVVREVRGHPTGRDVVGALDAATSGPTYRAGVLREAALERMRALEREHGCDAIAYEMLGPPRLSKLLFEAAILQRLYGGLRDLVQLDAAACARQAHALIERDADLRTRILSIGLPILLPDGRSLLRGPDVKVAPEPGQAHDDPRLADNGWVDLRPENWRRWSERARAMVGAIDDQPGPDAGSRADFDPESRRSEIRPGSMAGWVFRHEDRGTRIKR